MIIAYVTNIERCGLMLFLQGIANGAIFYNKYEKLIPTE